MPSRPARTWPGRRLVGGLSTFRRGFVTTLALDVVGRGLSAVTTVLLIRGLSVDGFAYVVLFIMLGQFAGSAATGGLRMRYMRAEAERVSRGIKEPSSFFAALAGSFALIGAAGAVGLVGATMAGVGGSAEERLTFLVAAALFTMGHAATELAVYHHQAHLAFRRAGLVGLLRNGVMCVVALGALAGAFPVGRGGDALVRVSRAGGRGVGVLAACLVDALVEGRDGRTLGLRPRVELADRLLRRLGWLLLRERLRDRVPP